MIRGEETMNEPFVILGISPTNDTRHIRAAFRRKAALLHPDRHGNTRAASECFKRVVRAYEVALRLARGEDVSSSKSRGPVTTPPPPAPIRERYACPRCDDTFPVDDTCPRCAEVVVDTWRGRRVEVPEDPRIAELITRLEAPPRAPVIDVPIPEQARPWIASTSFLAGAWCTASIGLPILGLMLGAFGLAIASLEAHDRVTRPDRVRLYVF
jgi:hypothetical protein